MDQAGLTWWAVTLVVRDAKSSNPETTALVVLRASLCIVDSATCEDPVVDLENISNDLGRLAAAYDEDLDGDGTGGWASFDGRVLFVEDLEVEPHWRGRHLATATILVAAAILGDAIRIVVEPAALSWRPDGGEAGSGGWQQLGFTALAGSDDHSGVYSVATGVGCFTAQLVVAQEALNHLRFTAEDVEWWREGGSSSTAT